ncbi:hypothetical protein G6F32_015771 [Rhizopus arrhizus]|nr:hypothetical protein G6F32_015771 [Rhizopus arrhizus]
MGFGVVEQLRQRLETVVGAVDYQRGGDDGKARDRLEVAGRIAGRLVEPMVDGLRAVGAIGQRIAVRLGPRSDGRADIAARAGAVFDDEGLAQRFGQVLGQIAAGHVGALPGLVGDDDPHRFGRIFVRRRGGLRE